MQPARVASALVALSFLPCLHSLGLRRGPGLPTRVEAFAAKLIVAEDQWVDQAQKVLQAQVKDVDARESVRKSCVQMAESAAEGNQWRKKKVISQLQRVCSSNAMEWEPRIDLCKAFVAEVDASMVEERSKPSKEGKVDFSNVCLHLYRTKVMSIAEKRWSREDGKLGDRKDAEQRDKELVARSEHELHNLASDKAAKQEALEEEARKQEELNEARAETLRKSQERFAEKQGGSHGLAAHLADEDQEHRGSQKDVIDDALLPLSSDSSDDGEVLEEMPDEKAKQVMNPELEFAQA